MKTASRLLCCTAVVASACIAVAAPADAAYFVVAKASASAGDGSCSDVDDSGVLNAPSAAASAACATGTAEATVDLATASLGVVAFADSTPQDVTISSAEAELFDVLHFQVPPAMQGQPFALGVVFAVDGAMTPDAAPHITTTLLLSRCVLADLGSIATFDGLFVDTTPVSGLRTIPGTIEITPPGYAMNVSMHMNAPGLTEGTVDFLTTGALQLALPPGVTYTSDSGFFHAPEPGAAAIRLAAIAALAFTRRR